MTPLLVFLVGLLYELLYTWWINATVAKHPLRAALFSAAVGAMSIWGVSAVVRDTAVLPWLVCGYGVGTYVAVRWLA